MKRKKLETTIISVTLIVMLIIIILGITYAAFVHTMEEEDTNAYTAACYDIAYDEEKSGVTFEKKYPVTDDQGLAQEPYTVTITNNCKKDIGFSIKLNVLNDSTTPDDLMKVSVNKIPKPVKSLDPVTESSTDYKKVYQLTSGGIKTSSSVTYEFRTWMDENSTDGENTDFKSKITVDILQDVQPTPIIEKILADKKLQTATPDFFNGYPVSSTDTSLSGLYAAEDDDGTSYYFRGAVDNNKVMINDQEWRIVRINGDGTIRMIKVESILDTMAGFSFYNIPKGAGFTYDNKEPCTKSNPCVTNFENGDFSNVGEFTNSTIKKELEKWYKTGLINYDKSIAMSYYCSDTSYATGDESGSFTFSPDLRRSSGKPTLKCPDPLSSSGQPRDYGGIYKTKIGLITLDELTFAGFSTKMSAIDSSNYLANIPGWTMTPRNYDGTYVGVYVSFMTTYGWKDPSWVREVHPVINLKPSALVFGDKGTDADELILAPDK